MHTRTMQILVTAASQRLNITDPMNVEECTYADTNAPASEQPTDNWEQQLALWTILSLEQGMQIAMRTRRRTHMLLQNQQPSQSF